LNNHHHALRDGEDIYGVEREKKDGKEQKFTLEPGCPGELCDTMVNGAFGYKVTDTEWKTTEEIRAMHKRTNDRGMNLLLNIAPRADGKLPGEAMKILAELAADKK
jgi:alpha-L-fucosidase